MLKLIPSSHEDPILVYAKANGYLAKGCLDIAESLYHKLLNLNESKYKVKREIRADSLHNLGMIYECRQDLEAAIDFYQQALRYDKQRGMTWLFLARLYFERFESFGRKQDYQAGIKALDKAAELKPEYPIIKILRAKYTK